MLTYAEVALACASRELAEKMFYVYIIKSRGRNWHYVGFTKNITNRFLAHSKGQVKSTKHYKPFKLRYVEIVKSRQVARELEKFLKVRFNKEALLEIL